MKKTIKRIFCVVLVVALVASLAGCAKINYITTGAIRAINEVKSGEWKETSDTTTSTEDTAVISELTPGTYGGTDFQSTEDVVAYFNEAYDYTKGLTAEYSENGETKTYYKLLCEETLEVGDVMIDGQSNSTINALVPGIVGGMFAAGTWGLSPCTDKDPNNDNNSRETSKTIDNLDFRKSLLTADDVLACNVTDNGDGTIEMQIQPKAGEMSLKGEDSQGRFFMVLGDISATVASISVLSFSEGDASDNVKVHYKGGTGTFKIDTATKEIVEADYKMVALVDVTHANVAIIKDKSASVTITYSTHFPASDEYLLENKNITRL